LHSTVVCKIQHTDQMYIYCAYCETRYLYGTG
jgi:hypothetical protein